MKTYYRLETVEPNITLTTSVSLMIAYTLLLIETGFGWQMATLAIAYFTTLLISTQKIKRTTKR